MIEMVRVLLFLPHEEKAHQWSPRFPVGLNAGPLVQKVLSGCMWLRDMLLGWLFHCAGISASRGYIIRYSKLKLWQILMKIRYCCFLATCSGSNKELQVSSECDAIFEWLFSALPSAELHSPRVVPSLSRLMFCVFYEYSAKNIWDLDFQAVLQSTALQKHLLQSLLINPNPKKRSISLTTKNIKTRLYQTTNSNNREVVSRFVSNISKPWILRTISLSYSPLHVLNAQGESQKNHWNRSWKTRTLQKWSLPFVGVKCHQKFKQSPFFWW